MIDLESLFRSLGPSEPLKELESADPSLDDAAMAVIHGEYLRAAQLAAERYAEGFYDARLLGYLLYGALLERGPAALAQLLRELLTGLRDRRAGFGPAKRKELLLDGAVQWFLSRVVQQLERAEQTRDHVWQSWQSAAMAGELEAVLPLAAELQPLLAKLVPKPRAPVPLLHLVDLLHQLQAHSASLLPKESAESSGDPNFSSASTLDARLPDTAPRGVEPTGDDSRASSAAPSPPPPDPRPHEKEGDKEKDKPREVPPPPAPDDAAASEQVELPPPSWRSSFEPPAPPPLRRLSPGLAGPRVVQASAALIELSRTIESFVSLVERKEHVHAAVVADAIQQAIDHFDPRIYLPALLAPYFRALTTCSSELAAIFERREHLSFRALAQLHKVDPAAFLGTTAQSQPTGRGGSRGDIDDESESLWPEDDE